MKYFTKTPYELEIEKMQNDRIRGITGKKFVITHSPGEISEEAKARERKLKGW